MRSLYTLIAISILATLTACGGGEEDMQTSPDASTQPVHCQQTQNACT